MIIKDWNLNLAASEALFTDGGGAGGRFKFAPENFFLVNVKGR